MTETPGWFVLGQIETARETLRTYKDEQTHPLRLQWVERTEYFLRCAHATMKNAADDYTSAVMTPTDFDSAVQRIRDTYEH